MAEISEVLLLAEVERRLASKYADLSSGQIAEAVRTAHARFEKSRIRDFVPLLVERHASAVLQKAVTTAVA